MDDFHTELLHLTSKEESPTFTPIYSPNNTGNIQVKITRLDENFLGDLKRKRKLSSDSLESLDDLEKTSYLQNVEQYLNDTGLNVQLIAKNDKKLVKLNLNKPNINFKDSIDRIKSIIKSDSPSPKSSNSNMNKSFSLEDIDDLPSESDVSSGVVIIPTNSPIQHSKNTPDANILSGQNSLTVCFKCNKCNKIFNDEIVFKLHQDSLECDAEVELEKFLQNDYSDQLQQEREEEKIQNSKLTRKKIFICTECGIQFYTQNDLNKHMLHTHESSKPYKCSQCTMTFFELSTKNRHEKEHLGLKPFRCYICSFEFTRASNLRTHLHKVHSNEIGTLVNITKSFDNKLKFEFDLEAIKIHKEQNKISKPFGSPSKESTSTVPNTVIYIKDPNNKNADIQHMVIYVDGKPIFVQNPKKSEVTEGSKDAQVPKTSINSKSSVFQSKNKSPTTSNLNKPVTKIPYLLAAAAAAAASNHRKQQQLNQQVLSQPKIPEPVSLRISTDDYLRQGEYDNPSPVYKQKELKHDQEYLQLVSMFKQKNEKLYNPLKTF